MTDKELKFIIEQGEGQFIEFKESPGNKFASEIVAFANAQGGRIFLGITDTGNIKGFTFDNKIKSQLIDSGRNCDPPINPGIKTFKNIVIIEIKESSNKPHSCRDGFYLRIGPNSQKLSRDEIFNFAYSEGRKFFDEQLNEEFNFPEDFDRKKLDDYLEAASLSKNLDIEDILINLGAAKKQDNKLYFNNAGILFFAKKPSLFLLSSKTVCGEFAGNEKVDILDKKEYDDGILENIRQGINFIKRRIKVKFIIKSAKRIEVPEYPEEAYREAVVNAVMHRDYTDKSGDTVIELFRDSLNIYNPGEVVSWMKAEDFGKVSKPRNPLIASLLARTEYVERMGTGINRMRNAMTKAGLAEPDIRQSSKTFFIIFKPKSSEGATQKTTQKTTRKTAQKIIELLKEKPELSRSALAELIDGITEDGIKYHLSKLQKEGRIKHVGPAKGGHWEVL